MLPDALPRCQDANAVNTLKQRWLASQSHRRPGIDSIRRAVQHSGLRRRRRGAVPKPFPGATSPAPPGATPPSVGDRPGTAHRPTLGPTESYALVGTALSLRGSPYRDGGSDPAGFDCSGFTQYVFAQHGVQLPREVRDQFRLGRSVAPRELAPGDLVFFSTTASGATHVAIAVGGDEFVHAPTSSGVVRVEHLSSSYWAPRYVGARRIQN
ncbi:MAG: glycoside hydrolase [Acidobacteria bacterium]|nr:MAG: glycoside hydrolase [Acidobacteriota bacterium]